MIDITALQTLLQQAADAELLPRFQALSSNRLSVDEKADGSLVTEADVAMQQRIESALLSAYPHIPVLGEESSPAQQQALLDQEERLWILDPLDGTSNFAAGFPFFGVSLALLEAGEVRLGVVYDPIRQECFYAEKGQGARLNGQTLRPKKTLTPLHKGVALIDFKRLPPALVQRLMQAPPYASQRSLGSGVLDGCWIAAGRAHVYLHGRQKLWDFAAASLILQEAGGHACTLDGEPVFQASLSPRSVIAALDEEMFQQWNAFISAPNET